jgi:hypothetical protein
VQLYRYFLSQSSEFCRHNPLCCFSTSVYCYFVIDSVRKLLDTHSYCEVELTHIRVQWQACAEIPLQIFLSCWKTPSRRWDGGELYISHWYRFCKPKIFPCGLQTSATFTPWCRTLFEELIVTRLIKKYPAFLWNPKVHYRVHTSPPPDPILSQLNPVRPIDPYLPKVHLNVTVPPTPRSSQWSHAFGPPNQNSVNTSPLPHACHMFSPPHSP